MRQLNTESTDGFSAFLNQCISGDSEAWQQFMSEFHGLISSVAYRTSRVDTDDLIQDIYLEIIKNHFKLLRRFEGGNRPAFLVYLKRTAENVAKNFMRKHLKHTSELGEVLMEIADDRPNPEAVMLADSDMELLRKAIDDLRQDYREVILLLMKGYRHREIAQILDIPLPTSLTRANRAHTLLKKALKIEIISEPANILS